METKEKIGKLSSDIKKKEDQVRKLCVGKTIKIISKYNGQPYGRSRKPLTGKCFKVTNASYDRFWNVLLTLEGQSLCIGLDEVEFSD